MSISYPLDLPIGGIKRVTFQHRSAVSVSRSPFTFAQQVFAHQGDMWSASLEFIEMEREDAEEWIGWRLSLNGSEGTFLLGDPKYTSPRGTWEMGSPLASVNGTHAAGVKTVALKDFTVGATGKIGDWLQFGSGATSRLHKVVQDFTADGSGLANVEIWPSLREDLANGDSFVTSSPKGLFCLAENSGDWTLDPDSGFILPPLQVMEAIRIS